MKLIKETIEWMVYTAGYFVGWICGLLGIKLFK